jgi:O6-methylguanine-DNA--protein-cysteine methyltransferase
MCFIEFGPNKFDIKFRMGRPTETALSKRGEMKTFSDKVYDLLRKVPKGRVTTYKEIAHALESRAYRGVGQAMKRNPYAPEVP